MSDYTRFTTSEINHVGGKAGVMMDFKKCIEIGDGGTRGRSIGAYGYPGYFLKSYSHAPTFR